MAKRSVRRAVALLGIALAWVVSALGSIAALLSAWMGRANWGDGQPRDSVAMTAALVVLAVIVPLFAAWLTGLVCGVAPVLEQPPRPPDTVSFGEPSHPMCRPIRHPTVVLQLDDKCDDKC